MDELLTIAKTLEHGLENCTEQYVDLTELEFFADDDGTMMLRSLGGNNTLYYFKEDISEGSDALVCHAQKQLCRVVGVPFTYFRKNRPSMRNRMIRGWQQSLEPDSEQSAKLLKYRKSTQFNTIRAIVPKDYADLKNHQILEAVMSTPDIPMEINFIQGDNPDSLILHFRILVGSEFEVLGTRVRMGIAVTCSDLGASNLIVDSFLHHIEDDVSFFAPYGSSSYFVSGYAGVREDEIRAIIPSLVQGIADQYSVYKETIESLEDFQGVQESCRIVGGSRRCFSQLRRAMYQEASECEDDMRSYWDFARHLAMIAKDFDLTKRVKTEFVAGSFLNLVFDRIERTDHG